MSSSAARSPRPSVRLTSTSWYTSMHHGWSRRAKTSINRVLITRSAGATTWRALKRIRRMAWRIL